MDFLNKAYQQLSELFSSMTPAARITSGIMLAAIAMSMVYLFQFQMSAGKVALYGNREFSAEEVGQMEGAFGNAGLNDYEVVGNRIKVPLNKRDLYYKAISDGSAIPYSIARDDETSAMSNPFMSNAMLTMQQKAATTKKLEQTIAQSRNISTATVSWGETKENPPFHTIRKTCSVTIQPIGNYQLTGDELQSIRRNIKGSLTGIKDADIQIIDLNGGSWSGDRIAAGSSSSELATIKRERESEYRNKIRNILAGYHGVRVEVDVEIDPTASTNTYRKTLETPTTIRSTSEKENTKSSSGGNGGAPGVRSNNNTAGANGPTSIAANRTNSSDIQKESTESIAGGAITSEVKAGFDVISAEATISIPQKYVEKYYAQMNPPADGEETTVDHTKLVEFFEGFVKKDVAELVRPLLKVAPSAGQDPYEQVVVVMDPSIELDPMPGPDYASDALSWLAGNWQNLGLIGFGLFAVVMLKSMVGTAVKENNADQTVEREFGSLLPLESDVASDEIEEVIVDEDGTKRIVKRKRNEGDEESVKEEKANQLLQRFQDRAPTLRDELVELVEADLDAAADVLRAWIGDPA